MKLKDLLNLIEKDTKWDAIIDIQEDEQSKFITCIEGIGNMISIEDIICLNAEIEEIGCYNWDNNGDYLNTGHIKINCKMDHGNYIKEKKQQEVPW